MCQSNNNNDNIQSELCVCAMENWSEKNPKYFINQSSTFHNELVPNLYSIFCLQ